MLNRGLDAIMTWVHGCLVHFLLQGCSGKSRESKGRGWGVGGMYLLEQLLQQEALWAREIKRLGVSKGPLPRIHSLQSSRYRCGITITTWETKINFWTTTSVIKNKFWYAGVQERQNIFLCYQKWYYSIVVVWRRGKKCRENIEWRIRQ